MLTDGTELTGKVVFNDNEGIVTIYSGEDSQSFNSRRIVKFEYYDAKTGRHKLFYSLEFKDPETGIKDTDIFEVLKETTAFVVLVRIDRIKTEARKSLLGPRSSPLLVDRSSKQFTQTQTVYFMNPDGDFEPYLRILEKEVDGELLDINQANNRYINADLFKKYTGSYYEALVEYAKQNDLSLKKKADIIYILDKYEEMIRSNN